MAKPAQTSLCPACGEPLVILEFQGIEIDHCLSCSGTWLDAGEFESIAENAGVEKGAITSAFFPTGKNGKGKKVKRKCPRCLSPLRMITTAGKIPVEIDRCPRGHGLWFDKGEVETLIRSCKGDEERVLAGWLQNFTLNEMHESDKA